MLKIFFAAAVAILFSANPLFAQPSAELKTEMRKFKSIIEGLKPYMMDNQKFNAKENEKDITAQIEHLRSQIESTAHRGYLIREDYKTTLAMLSEHVRSTEKNFAAGRKDFARYMLHNSLQTCISCHSRLPANTAPFMDDVPLAKNKIRFAEAEFLFATRRFSEVTPVFETLVQNYPKNDLSLSDAMGALDYTATLYARILRDPKGGAKAFTAILKKKNLPPFLTEDVEGWRDYFDAWGRQKPFEFEGKKDTDVIAAVEGILKEEKRDPYYLRDRSNDIAFLRASGLLHEFLIHFPESPLRPQAYYLLGQSYLSLSQQFFTGVDQMYLKQCIQDFPKSPVAKKCYNLLEESIYLGYSGSSGTHVPYDVLQELNKFKKSVY